MRADNDGVNCPTCRAPNPTGAGWCQLCFVPFADDAAGARRRVEAEQILARRVAESARPASDAFVRTASTTLERLFARGPLVYREPGGDVQASVHDGIVHDEAGRRGRYTVLDRSDQPVFVVEPYLALDAAVAVFDPHGEPLATVVRGEELLVRDGTGAPVAAARRQHGRLNVVETGSAELLAQIWRDDQALGDVTEDRWSTTVFEEPIVLDRRALVALPLACRLLHPSPPRARVRVDHLGRGTGGAVDALDALGTIFDW